MTFKCFKSEFNAMDFILQFQKNFHTKHPDLDHTTVVIHPSHYTNNVQFWRVDEVYHDHITLLGEFPDVSRACQFADCYTFRDYDWYNGNITWNDNT